MELGGISEFRYTPKWKGNDALPEGQRLSLSVKRLRAIDVLQDISNDEAFAWRDNAFKRWIEKKGDTVTFTGYAAGLEKLDPTTLRIMRTVLTHVDGLRGFMFDAKEVTDATEVFVRLPMPAGEDQTENLLLEIFNVIGETSNMTGDELKNYSSPSDGTAAATT
jgi:hypothetical protein